MAEKLLIVGGGLSGLYLASLLEDIYEVTLLEARDRLGGRIFSINGHDMGASWIWSHHKNMLALINDLNLELFPQYNTGHALYDTKEKIELFNPPPSAPSARVNGTLVPHNYITHKNAIFRKETVCSIGWGISIQCS